MHHVRSRYSPQAINTAVDNNNTEDYKLDGSNVKREPVRSRVEQLAAQSVTIEYVHPTDYPLAGGVMTCITLLSINSTMLSSNFLPPPNPERPKVPIPEKKSPKILPKPSSITVSAVGLDFLQASPFLSTWS